MKSKSICIAVKAEVYEDGAVDREAIARMLDDMAAEIRGLPLEELPRTTSGETDGEVVGTLAVLDGEYERCSVCGAETVFMHTEEGQPPEYDVCHECDAHVCPECTIIKGEVPYCLRCVDAVVPHYMRFVKRGGCDGTECKD